MKCIGLIFAAAFPLFALSTFAAPPPTLSEQHGATQLRVDGKPFLILGGELDNSSASSRDFMRPIWPKLQAMNLNTVLAPVYWEFLEPEEGRFDFSSVDDLIADARKHDMHLVLLWFGSWKNSQSSYVPGWVKRDQSRFPRARRSDGTGLEILSALSESNLDADKNAFVALMQHLKDEDNRHTVVMVQPENEVGMIPEARDHSPEAEAAFAARVPAALTDYLTAHKETLAPALRDVWLSRGARVGASWEDTFGKGPTTDELFSAWTGALYTGKVAAAGKAVYPLPMYANAALIRPGRLPGQYPSGGPLPHLFDVWHAAAPALDMLSPDLYFPNFVEWALRYVRPGISYFIPETGRADAADMAANGFWAFARLGAIGFSPYALEFLSPGEQKVLGEAYELLNQISPLVLAAQGTARIAGIRPTVSFEGVADLSPQKVTLGQYSFDVRFKLPPPISIGSREEIEIPGAHGGFIIQTGPEEYFVAGTGMVLFFGTVGQGAPLAGIEAIQEGRFVEGTWTPGRTLNGDETNQGRQLVLPAGKFALYRVRLYRFR